MSRYRSFLFLFVLLLFVAFLLINKEDLQKTDHLVMDRVEKANFEKNLQHFFSGDLGYTLIGVKPMSMESGARLYRDPKTKQRLFTFLRSTFKDTSKFILRIVEYQNRFYEVVLIHKNAFRQMLAKEPLLGLFVKENFGNEEAFFREVQKEEKSILSIFQGNQILLGIAFGYGKENSKFFQRRCQVGTFLKKYPLFCLLPSRRYGCIKPIESKKTPLKEKTLEFDAAKFRSLEDEWQWIQENCVVPESNFTKYSSYVSSPVLFRFPLFVARKGQETEEIYEKFRIGRIALSSLFLGKESSQVVQESALQGN